MTADGVGGARLEEARSLDVRAVDPVTDPRWDRFVLTHPRGGPYQRAAWLQVLAAEYDQPRVCLVCEDGDGRLVGALPLVETRGVPLGLGGPLGAARLCSLPRTAAAGPLADAPDATAALLAAAVAHAADRDLRLQVKPVTSDLDGLVPGLVGVPWRDTYVLHLPADPSAPCFDTRHRERRLHHLVRKAEADGVTVRPGTAGDLAAWYRLYLEAMRLHAQPARPRRLFRALLEACEHDPSFGRFTVAVAGPGAGDRLLGGVFCLDGTTTTSYAFTGLDRRAGRSHPVDALLWDAIHHAHAAGMERFDLGEVPRGHDALATFKLKWGARPEPVRRYYWPAVGAEGAGERGPTPRSASLAVTVWRHLPLPATELVGRVLHRYL